VLGLGASTKALVKGFHDIAFEHPAAKQPAVRDRPLQAAGPTARPACAQMAGGCPR
jgi:hypothetical protein